MSVLRVCSFPKFSSFGVSVAPAERFIQSMGRCSMGVMTMKYVVRAAPSKSPKGPPPPVDR
jgi:hypothetical protein